MLPILDSSSPNLVVRASSFDCTKSVYGSYGAWKMRSEPYPVTKVEFENWA